MAKTKRSNPLLVVAGLGLLVGLYGVFEALVYRTEATGLGSYVPWGLGVVLYLLFLGLSAGGLLVNCLVYILGKKELDRVAGVVTYATLVTEVCAGIAIALDLGHWERMYRFISTPSLTSPMLNRGGRYQAYDKAYKDGQLVNKYGKMVGLYFENMVKAKDSMR